MVAVLVRPAGVEEDQDLVGGYPVAWCTGLGIWASRAQEPDDDRSQKTEQVRTRPGVQDFTLLLEELCDTLCGTLKLIAAKITHWMSRRPPGTCARDFH